MSNEESMAMFFDKEFNPATYVDQLFNSILGDCSNPSIYDKLNTHAISNDVSSLITHLDYYTQELSTNDQLDTLQHSMVYLNDNTTRLEYYTNIFNNSIITLNQDLSTVNEKLVNNNDSEAINKLIDLKLVRQNLTKVLGIFEMVFVKLNQKSSISPLEFEALLANIKQNDGFEAGLFDHLAKFNPIYRKWYNNLNLQK